MKYFWKAIQQSFRYKWTIVLSVLNAICIAGLWSASISTVYPFVEVVFEGKTVHTWLAEGIAASEAEIHRLQTEIAGLHQEFNQQTDPEKRGAITGQIAIREGHMALHEQNRQGKLGLKPYADRWGPHTPFGTLMVVIAVLILATALKGICLVLSVVLVARISSGTVVDLRRIFFREMLRMDQRTIDRLGTTNLMTMLSHNVNLVQAGLQSLYGRSLIEPFKMFACLACAFAISWQLLLVSLLLVPVGAYLIHFLGQRMRAPRVRKSRGTRRCSKPCWTF